MKIMLFEGGRMRERLSKLTREERRLLRENVRDAALTFGVLYLAFTADAWVERVLRIVGWGA